MVVGLDEFGLLILPRCFHLDGDGDDDGSDDDGDGDYNDNFDNDCYGSFDNGRLQLSLTSYKGKKCVIYHHFWAQDEAPQLVRKGVELASLGSLAPSFHRVHAYERVEQLIDVSAPLLDFLLV